MIADVIIAQAEDCIKNANIEMVAKAQATSFPSKTTKSRKSAR